MNQIGKYVKSHSRTITKYVICPVCLGFREILVYDKETDVTKHIPCETCDNLGIVLMTKKITYQKINGNTEHSQAKTMDAGEEASPGQDSRQESFLQFINLDENK